MAHPRILASNNCPKCDNKLDRVLGAAVPTMSFLAFSHLPFSPVGYHYVRFYQPHLRLRRHHASL
jgi:hypothetical protein